jgi:hypothetical protein
MPTSTKTPMTLRISRRARAHIAARAAARGQNISVVASELLEQAATRPNVDEVLAPFRKQVAASGLTDRQLDDFFRQEIESHRHEKKALSQ